MHTAKLTITKRNYHSYGVRCLKKSTNSIQILGSLLIRVGHGLDASMDWTGLDWVECWKNVDGLDWIGLRLLPGLSKREK